MHKYIETESASPSTILALAALHRVSSDTTSKAREVLSHSARQQALILSLARLRAQNRTKFLCLHAFCARTLMLFGRVSRVSSARPRKRSGPFRSLRESAQCSLACTRTKGRSPRARAPVWKSVVRPCVCWTRLWLALSLCEGAVPLPRSSKRAPSTILA